MFVQRLNTNLMLNIRFCIYQNDMIARQKLEPTLTFVFYGELLLILKLVVAIVCVLRGYPPNN